MAKIKNGEKVDHHETVRVHKNGQRIDVSLSVSPIRSHSGAIIGAAKVARDIGARKKAQEALLESEQMSRAIIDTALDAFRTDWMQPAPLSAGFPRPKRCSAGRTKKPSDKSIH